MTWLRRWWNWAVPGKRTPDRGSRARRKRRLPLRRGLHGNLPGGAVAADDGPRRRAERCPRSAGFERAAIAAPKHGESRAQIRPRLARTRLKRGRGDIERDRTLQAQVEPYATALRQLDAAADQDSPSAERERLRWMLEEFRVSLFARELRTTMPVSAKRLEEQLALARREAMGLG